MKKRLRPQVKKTLLLLIFITFIAYEMRLAYIVRNDPVAFIAYKNSIMEHK